MKNLKNKSKIKENQYIKKLDQNELDYIIHQYPEQSKIDFKEKLTLDNENSKAEFIKDICAIANAPINLNGYIIYGIQNNGKVKGTTIQYDEASLQEMVQSKLYSTINFQFYPLTYNEKTIGICVIAAFQKRPIVVKKNFAFLREGNIFIRRGSSTGIATPDEIRDMILLTDSQSNHMRDFKAEIRKKILSGEKVSSILGEFYDSLLTLPRSEWIKFEIKGYPEENLNKNPEIDHRKVNGYISIREIPKTYLTLKEVVQINKDIFWEFPIILPDPILRLERWLEDANKIPNSYAVIKIPRESLIEDEIIKSDTAPNTKYYFVYFEGIQLKRTIEKIKEKILEMLD